MKKLSLSLDALSVTSFDTASVQAEQGTVEGLMMATPGRSCARTACCPETYQVSCADTCTC